VQEIQLSARLTGFCRAEAEPLLGRRLQLTSVIKALGRLQELLGGRG